VRRRPGDGVRGSRVRSPRGMAGRHPPSATLRRPGAASPVQAGLQTRGVGPRPWSRPPRAWWPEARGSPPGAEPRLHVRPASPSGRGQVVLSPEDHRPLAALGRGWTHADTVLARRGRRWRGPRDGWARGQGQPAKLLRRRKKDAPTGLRRNGRRGGGLCRESVRHRTADQHEHQCHDMHQGRNEEALPLNLPFEQRSPRCDSRPRAPSDLEQAAYCGAQGRPAGRLRTGRRVWRSHPIPPSVCGWPA
jgi:hypothetical protein